MYVRAGRPAFARPCVGVHKSRSTSLMSSSLLLQQCPACLVRLLPGSGHIDTAIWLHYMDANKTAGEEARRQLHKNATCNLKQVLAETPHKTPTVRPPAPYHENYSSLYKRNEKERDRKDKVLQILVQFARTYQRECLGKKVLWIWVFFFAFLFCRNISEFIKFRVFFKVLFSRILSWIFFQLFNLVEFQLSTFV